MHRGHGHALLPLPTAYSPIQFSPFPTGRQSQPSYNSGPNAPGSSVTPSTPTVKLLPPHVLKSKFPIPDEILQDLIIRFVMNIPEEEAKDPVRVCFQIELAHWFFVDHYCEENKDAVWRDLREIPFPDFAYLMFQKIHFLRDKVKDLEKTIQEFREYKMKVPTFGAILMDQDLTKVVLVQGFRGSWMFPKGKINKDEAPAACAAREVLEETGYDCSPLLDEDQWVESCALDRWTRLYFIRGVDPQIPFKPHTRYEIKNIGWFNIKDLPESKADTSVVARPGYPHSAFGTVFPFVKRLRRWIEDKLSGKNELSCFKSNAPNRPSRILDRKLDGGTSRQGRTSESKGATESSKSKKAISRTPGKGKFSSGSAPVQSTAIANTKTEPLTDSGRQIFHAFQFQSPFATPLRSSAKDSTKHGSGNTELSQIGLSIESMLKNSLKQLELNSAEDSCISAPSAKKLNPKRKLFASDDEKEGIDLKTIFGGGMGSVGGSAFVSKTKGPVDAITFTSSSWTNFSLNSDQILRAMLQ